MPLPWTLVFFILFCFFWSVKFFSNSFYVNPFESDTPINFMLAHVYW